MTQQARVLELVGNLSASVRRYRHISQLDSMNTEALACIAVSYFYGNQPETALLYYRRILSMGAHSAELYCNIGLCCLYGGQLDLVFPCFQRAIRMSTTAELKADVWYNLSFVAMVSSCQGKISNCNVKPSPYYVHRLPETSTWPGAACGWPSPPTARTARP